MTTCTQCGRGQERFRLTCPDCGFPMVGRGTIELAPPSPAYANAAPDLAEKLLVAEETSFWARTRSALIVRMLRDWSTEPRDLLELGCGGGIVLAAVGEAFPELRLVGADLDPEALRLAQRRLPDVQFLLADACDLPFEEDFDLVTACDVLEHIDEDERALAELFRSLRPGGALVVTVPYGRFLWSQSDDFALHRRRYGRRELVRKVGAAGFEVARISSFVSLLLPVMLLSRLSQRAGDSYDPLREFRRAARLEPLLRPALELDRYAIERGLNLPVGGSLLLVATRPSAA